MLSSGMSAIADGIPLRLRYCHGSATFGKCSLPETSTGWIVLNKDPAHVDASPVAAQCILLRLWRYTETFLARWRRSRWSFPRSTIAAIAVLMRLIFFLASPSSIHIF